MTKREASRETLERLAETVDQWFLNGGSGVQLPRWLAPALSAYRAEITPPLRTRTEVDTEIATIMRRVDAEARAAGGWGFGHRRLGDENRVGELCAEPTAPEAELARRKP